MGHREYAFWTSMVAKMWPVHCWFFICYIVFKVHHLKKVWISLSVCVQNERVRKTKPLINLSIIIKNCKIGLWLELFVKLSKNFPQEERQGRIGFLAWKAVKTSYSSFLNFYNQSQCFTLLESFELWIFPIPEKLLHIALAFP